MPESVFKYKYVSTQGLLVLSSNILESDIFWTWQVTVAQIYWNLDLDVLDFRLI